MPHNYSYLQRDGFVFQSVLWTFQLLEISPDYNMYFTWNVSYVCFFSIVKVWDCVWKPLKSCGLVLKIAEKYFDAWG